MSLLLNQGHCQLIEIPVALWEEGMMAYATVTSDPGDSICSWFFLRKLSCLSELPFTHGKVSIDKTADISPGQQIQHVNNLPIFPN